MSLNVIITQSITLYLLEQYSIPVKPVLGGVKIVVPTTNSIKQSLLFSNILGSLYF